VISYSLDAEGAGLGLQIISCLWAANINVADGIAGKLPVGGFAAGVHVQSNDDGLLNAIIGQLSAAGLFVENSSIAFMVGGMAPGTAGMAFSAFDASILVGVKPVRVLTKETAAKVAAQDAAKAAK
jgi:hypothetical protein